MEWSKSTITGRELEKKQREFIEQAMRMAKKAAPANEPDSVEEEKLIIEEAH